jgi:hypothetical protein
VARRRLTAFTQPLIHQSQEYRKGCLLVTFPMGNEKRCREADITHIVFFLLTLFCLYALPCGVECFICSLHAPAMLGARLCKNFAVLSLCSYRSTFCPLALVSSYPCTFFLAQPLLPLFLLPSMAPAYYFSTLSPAALVLSSSALGSA